MLAFLFDLDGTMIRSKEVIIQLINETLEEFDYNPFTEKEMLSYVGMPLEDLLSIKVKEENLQDVCRRYIEKYLEKGLRATRPYDGIMEMLEELKDSSTKIGIITTKSEREAKIIVNYLGFSNYVDVVIAHNRKLKPKPNPDPIFQACSILSVQPERSVMIGDTSIDIRAGKRAGTFATVGVLWGIGKERELKDADYVAHTVDELRAYLKRVKDQLIG